MSSGARREAAGRSDEHLGKIFIIRLLVKFLTWSAAF